MPTPPDADALFRAHAVALRAYLARFVGDDALADDLLQETFARYLDRAPALREARAWLFTVATNLAIQDGRTQRRRAQLLARAAPDDLFAAPERPGHFLERQEREERVRAALGALAERDRTVLLMREAGFSHREIAVAADTTTKSVGTIIARALAKLERALGLDEDAL